MPVSTQSEPHCPWTSSCPLLLYIDKRIPSTLAHRFIPLKRLPVNEVLLLSTYFGPIEIHVHSTFESLLYIGHSIKAHTLNTQENPPIITILEGMKHQFQLETPSIDNALKHSHIILNNYLC